MPRWVDRIPYFIVFAVGALVMVFEILMSRLLAPYFGSSVYTWGNLIGVILSAMALGYWLGGREARTHGKDGLPAGLLFGVGLYLCSLPWVVHPICSSIVALRLPILFGVLFALVLLCTVPVTLMTMTFPLMAHRLARDESEVGPLTGRLGVASTFGSLFGTFLSTFVLVNVPWLGTRRSLLISGILIALCGALLSGRKKSLAWMVVPLFLGGAGKDRLIPPLRPTETLLSERETPYHSIRVLDIVPLQGPKRRVLSFGDAFGEQTSLDLDRAGQPSINIYTQLFFLSWALKPTIKSIAILGAGGGVVPRDISRFLPGEPGLSLDVVDIDPGVFRVAREFFGYPEGDPRIRSHAEDARLFLKKSRRSYDLIFLDVYSSGSQIPDHLITKEFFDEARERLAPGGVLALNLLLSQTPGSSGETSGKYLSVLKTLYTVFAKENVFPFATSRFFDTWPQHPVIDDGGVVLAAVEGLPRQAPDFSKADEKLPRFGALYGRNLASFDIALHAPAVSEEDAVKFSRAPVLSDEVNPINLLD